MKIIEVIPDSFQEYEGNHSICLFTSGCNFRCPGCYNLGKVLKARPIYPNSMMAVKDNISPMHNAVVMLGGEPTMHKEDFLYDLRCIKDYEPSLEIKVFTNGSNPEYIKRAEGLVDSWSIDFKALIDVNKVINKDGYISDGDVVYYETDQDYIDEVTKSIVYALSYSKQVEVRTTLFEGLKLEVPIEEQAKDIGVYLTSLNVKHIIQKDFRKNLERKKHG